MNRNQRATRNNTSNKPFVSGGVMTNFTASPVSAMNLTSVPPEVAQAQAINVGRTKIKY